MHITADLDVLLRTTARAFCDTLRAVLVGEPHRAQGVLDGAAGRAHLVAAARDDLASRPWVPAPQLVEQLRFVDDVARLGDLVEELAELVGTPDGLKTLTPSRRREVSVLLDAGGRRLRQLLDSPSGPAIDPAYRGCGAALFEVADHAGRDSSAVVLRCGELATLLLRASRHASRAA